jgi:hypothetical protein
MPRFYSTWEPNTFQRRSRVNRSQARDEGSLRILLTDGKFGAMMNVSLINEVMPAHGLRIFCALLILLLRDVGTCHIHS